MGISIIENHVTFHFGFTILVPRVEFKGYGLKCDARTGQIGKLKLDK